MDKEYEVTTGFPPAPESESDASVAAESVWPRPPHPGPCPGFTGEAIDIFVKVVKAKNTQLDEVIVGYVDEYGIVHGREICLDPSTCCCAEGVSGPVTCVEDVRIRNLQTSEEFICTSRVRVHLLFDVVIIYRALCTIDDTTEEVFCIETLRGVEFTKEIMLDEFAPPLTPEEFLTEIDQSEIIVRNFRFEVDINGRCSGIILDPTDPNMNTCIPSVSGPGTCVSLTVFADITDKLGRMEDVLICGRRNID